MTEEPQYDVLVVGSGGGAMTGALLAAQAGLRTVVAEKTAHIGGTSAYSGGVRRRQLGRLPVRPGLPGARAPLGSAMVFASLAVRDLLR